MAQVFLGLGSNLGNRLEYLQEAVSAIPDLVAVSGLYETEPVGGPEQGVFLNIVVELSTDLSPRSLLNLAHELEVNADRSREIHWGPRTLDVDVLWIEGEAVNEPDLVVPHPRMRDRAFVMIPLGELAPEFLNDWNDIDKGQIIRLSDW
ncbi:MAG: 2-amino-4-hydroxy-6-hydroxymethyldihydropteridine diphosphokinase [Acidimicrobiales bacterium]|nr:2-amino-4-hydroxy-6-hydroxymethyldihydropteridine diphosphokinase [Acidimicrobiales bacterium]MDG1846907.1 2-amino-4-hydroxy-6-hydroxymethyldihydropteridine diphosphokinase [Acidimicrobiales bacterium]